MTARSPHVGLVELEPSLYRRGDDPMCVQRIRDGVANGIAHKADSFAQCIVNFQPANEGLGFEAQEPRRWATGRDRTMAAAEAGEFYVIEPSPFAVVDLPSFGSGEHYELRLRSAWGAAGKGFGSSPPSASVTVRIYAYPWTDRASPFRTEHERLVDHVWEATFATGDVHYSGAWVTGATRGAGAYANKLVLDRASTEWPRYEVNAANAVGGLDRRRIDTLRIAIGVVASVSLGATENPQVIPLLRALRVDAFVGVADG